MIHILLCLAGLLNLVQYSFMLMCTDHYSFAVLNGISLMHIYHNLPVLFLMEIWPVSRA